MKRIGFIILSLIFFAAAFLQAKPVETELLKAFITPNSQAEKNIVKIAGMSSKKLNIILEADDFDTLEEMKSEFEEFKLQSYADEVVEVYRNYPANFLTEEDRNLIKAKDYKTLEQKGLEKLYNPLGFYVSPPDKDPYLFANDFLMQNQKFQEENVINYNGKFYSVIHVETDNPSKIIEKQKPGVYLTGTPVHSYVTSTKSNTEINIICLISTLAIILLARFYFKSIKILFPIILSIVFGILMGYSVSTFVFDKIHILTFVFSTSLIGVSLDYSLHYYLTGKEKGFKKSLTSSMLTTVTAFGILAFSDIEVLRQIAVFTSFGLIGVYLFVLIILPMFKLEVSSGGFKKLVYPKIKPYFFALILVVILIGGFKIQFNDNLKNLYNPPKDLAYAESLYQKVFTPKSPEFIITTGKNIDEILQKEEELNLDNAINLSRFVSSSSRQKENIELVKSLYDADLDNYATFLNKENIQKLKNRKLEVYPPQIYPPEIYPPENFPLKSEFMLDNNTSCTLVFEKTKDSINIADSISQILRNLRHKCFILIPCAFLILFVFLSFLYGIKNAFKITLSPLLGAAFAVTLLSLTGVEINLFHILALFLIIGFSLDYSIFRLNSGENSKDAVFLSCASTAISFLLLSFTSFKLISSLGITLFLGIFTSYLVSLFMIKSNHGKKEST